MTDIELIKKHILGDFIINFSSGSNGWSIQFSDCQYVLCSQNVISSDEVKLNELYKEHYSVIDKTTDKEDIAKSTIVSCCLRQKIIDLKMDAKKNLEIFFENGISIIYTTDMDIVDWQWAFTSDGKCPYTTEKLLIGCMWQNETQRETS